MRTSLVQIVATRGSLPMCNDSCSLRLSVIGYNCNMNQKMKLLSFGHFWSLLFPQKNILHFIRGKGWISIPDIFVWISIHGEAAMFIGISSFSRNSQICRLHDLFSNSDPQNLAQYFRQYLAPRSGHICNYLYLVWISLISFTIHVLYLDVWDL